MIGGYQLLAQFKPQAAKATVELRRGTTTKPLKAFIASFGLHIVQGQTVQGSTMPTITLTVLSGPAAGSSCTKDHNKPIRIGRVKNGNALMVKDASVSSKHLEFTWSDGDWFALDMGSSNGTRLNKSQVPMMADQTYKLRDKDKLQLGPDTLIQVHIEQESAAGGADEEAMTVEEKLLADAERLAASIQAAAEASQQQLREDWNKQRKALQAIVHG